MPSLRATASSGCAPKWKKDGDRSANDWLAISAPAGRCQLKIVYEQRTARVSQFALVPFQASEYSVSSRYAGRRVSVIARIDEVAILIGKKVIARHVRC